jgi:GTP cyclohydrolase II
VASVRLMTNNPDKIQELVKLGIDVTERVALETTVYPDNVAYLLTKVQRMNHLLDPSSLMSVLVSNLNGHH